MTTRTVTCRRCRHDRPVLARGLCATCYGNARFRGELDQYPPARSTANQIQHGHFTLAIKQRCTCPPCSTYYRDYYDRANAAAAARRRQAGATEQPAVSAAMRTKKKRAKPVARPMELGNPDRADEVLIANVLAGRAADATHPDDRAAVFRAYRAGQIGKNAALKAMRCSTAALEATIQAQENNAP